MNIKYLWKNLPGSFWREVYTGALLGSFFSACVIAVGALEGAVSPVTGRPMTWSKAGAVFLSSFIGWGLYWIALKQEKEGDCE